MANFDPKKSDMENLCDALNSIAWHLGQIGSTDAIGPGAIEFLSMQIREAVGCGLHDIAAAIRETS